MIATSAFAQAMPDSALTPGAVASTDIAEICARVDGQSYSVRHRLDRDARHALKVRTLLKYGIDPRTGLALFEDDDRVPICVGGDNANPLNHWAQSWPEAHVKDKLESAICRWVCAVWKTQGINHLPEAQALFLGDWRSRL